MRASVDDHDTPPRSLDGPRPAQGLSVGTTGTSYIFLACILALVTFLSVTRRDQTPPEKVMAEAV